MEKGEFLESRLFFKVNHSSKLMFDLRFRQA